MVILVSGHVWPGPVELMNLFVLFKKKLKTTCKTSFSFKVVDSCRIFSTNCSDTFRSFLYMERSKNLEKKCHNRAKKSPS